MKCKVKKLEGTARQLEVKVSREEIEEARKEVVKDLQKEAVIPGFRKGKAPEDLVMGKYRETIGDELKERVIPRAYQEALEESKIDPVSFPEISGVKLAEDGTALEFVAVVDTYPEVSVSKYTGIKVDKEKVSVSDEEVEEAVTRLQQMHAEYHEVDRAIVKDDFGICEVEAFIEDKSVSPKKDKVWIEANKESSMFGLGEGLCGMKKGETKSMEVTLPEDYPDKSYAGKRARFEIMVKEIREKKLPEKNDEFAKKSGSETMEKMKEEIRGQILERKETNSKIKMQNQIIEYLLKKHSFALPASMVKRQLEVLVKKAEDELARKGMDEKAVAAQKEALSAQLKEEADNRVKLYFILDVIARKEDIAVSDEEIDEWLKGLAGHYNRPFDEVKKYYQEKDLLGGVEEQLREDKILDYLLSQAAITEK